MAKDTEVAVMTKTKEYANCNLVLPTESEAKLEGFGGVGVNDKVTLVVTGTVKEISDTAEPWNPGKRMTVRIKKCKIQGPDKKTSIDDALKDSVSKV